MNAKKADRTRSCSRSDALQFITRAESHFDAIDLLSVDDDLLDSAANLAVSAAINACDAVCCARLKEHSQGQDHMAAVKLLEKVSPNGKAMATDLRRVLQKKNDAQYRQTPISATDAKRLIEWARRLVGSARLAVDLD